MFSKDEISFFNSKDRLASDAAAGKSLPSSCGISRKSSLKSPEGTRTPRQLTRGVEIKPNPLAQSENDNKNIELLTGDFSKNVEKIFEELLNGFTFDWLQFTPCSVDETHLYKDKADEQRVVRDLLKFCMTEGLHPADAKGGSNGYGVVKPFLKSGNSKVTALAVATEHGSCQMPNITVYAAKGLCETLGPRLLRLYSTVLLSRADIKYDFSREGLYDELLAAARQYVKVKNKGREKDKRALKFNKRYSHVDAEEIGYEGRSFSLGTRGGTHFLRVYEKDLERLAKKEIKPDEVDKHLVRIEVEIRPQSTGKKDFARMQPKDMLLTSLWLREFIKVVAGVLFNIGGNFKLKPKKVAREYREKTLTSTVEHGVKQYGKSFADLAIDKIIQQKFGGDYAAGKLSYAEVRQRAIELFAQKLDQTGIVKDRMKKKHVLEALTDHEYQTKVMAEITSFAKNKEARKAQAMRNMAELQKAVAKEFLGSGAYAVCKARVRHALKTEKHENFAFNRKIKKIRNCQIKAAA